MDFESKIKNLRNSFDFYLRSQIRMGRTVTQENPIDQKYQSEMQSFLELFPWETTISKARTDLVIADIGARNFALAPVLDKLFSNLGFSPEIHGIEIDAYRRMKSFHTRKDYGVFYAKKSQKAFFHPIDFLEWEKKLDIALLLNPFVTEKPLLHWGLPLSKLKPEAILEHCWNLLSNRRGFLVLSCPTEKELQISETLMEKLYFKKIFKTTWEPSPDSLQTQARFGTLYQCI